ncbi:MAG TPA: SRPBCC domain-containing protein [Candidatus Limnocylindrales bacterium]|nr:SRPBCC domain-containing protein [Candidatus Limnocylindrales bacterium]
MIDDPMAPTFRALSDPSRRLLLDRLFERDGQTLGELCTYLPTMTRFGVMRHLGVLEEAGLVTTRREGREKRHFLNPVPIRLVHDRWIGKFAEPVVGAMAAMKRTLEAEAMSTPDHVYSVYIKASPDRVWRAITDGVETERYYYGTRVDSDWSKGGRIVYAYPDGSVAADGEILDIDPGRFVRMTFLAHWDPDFKSAGPVTMAWEIEPQDDGGSKLTVTTSGLVEGSKMAAEFGGGIVYIVSGLKTYVETGAPLSVPAEVG